MNRKEQLEIKKLKEAFDKFSHSMSEINEELKEIHTSEEVSKTLLEIQFYFNTMYNEISKYSLNRLVNIERR